SKPIEVPDPPETPSEPAVEPAVEAGPPSIWLTWREAYGRALVETSAWTDRIEIGARMLDGNTDEDYVNVRGKFERQKATKFAQFDLGGQYGRSGGDPTSNKWFANGTIDFDRGGNWIMFVTARNEFDEFEKLDYRGTLSSGLGYRFYNEAEKRLIVRLGPAVTYEKFRKPREPRLSPDLFAEVELKWPLLDRLQFEHKTTAHPTIDDFDVVRLINDSGLLVQLNEHGSWSLKVGLRHEYTSRPDENRQPSDFITSVLLVYERK
ncbi:MAG: DUF481 domain-containing protein, partial [Planctomycetaceae bacterium]